MNVLAILGSGRRAGASETLVDKVIEGVAAGGSAGSVRKLRLTDHDIGFCRNCQVCRESAAAGPYVGCSIRDDMDEICEAVAQAEGLIFGTPVHMGYAPAVMTAFLERICWRFAKPEGQVLGIKGCPVPRTDKKRRAVIVVTSGVVPPLLRRFCDQATPMIRGTIRDSLNATTVGDLYAGAVERRGAEYYFDKAIRLGKRL